MNNLENICISLMIFHKGYSSIFFKDEKPLERIKKIWGIGTVVYVVILYLINLKCDDEKKIRLISYTGIMYFVDMIALGIHYRKSLVDEKIKEDSNQLTQGQINNYRILKTKLEEAIERNHFRLLELSNKSL